MILGALLATICIVALVGAIFGATVRRAYMVGGQPLVKRVLIHGMTAAAALLLPYYLFVYRYGHIAPWRYWLVPWLLTVAAGLLPLALSVTAMTLRLLPGAGSARAPGLVVTPALVLILLTFVLGLGGSVFVRGAVWFTLPVEFAIAGLWALTALAIVLLRTRRRPPGAPTDVEHAPGTGRPAR